MPTFNYRSFSHHCKHYYTNKGAFWEVRTCQGKHKMARFTDQEGNEVRNTYAVCPYCGKPIDRVYN